MAKTTQERLQEHLSHAHPPQNGGDLADPPHDPDTGEVMAEPEVEATYEGVSNPVQFVPKITISTCGGNPGAAKAEQKRVSILSVFGKAIEVKLVEDPTRKGPDGNAKQWEALGGAFQAVNMQNGQEFQSGILYLPDAFQTMLLSLVKDQNAHRVPKGRANFMGFDFAFQIDAVPSKNPIGYSYVMRSLLPPTKADPLAALRERTYSEIGFAQTKMLPAPTERPIA